MEEEQYFAGENFDSETVFIEDGEKEIHPLFRKEVFFFKVLLSAILVLSVAILYKNAPSSLTVRKLLQKSDERRISICYCSEMVRKTVWKTSRVLFA